MWRARVRRSLMMRSWIRRMPMAIRLRAWWRMKRRKIIKLRIPDRGRSRMPCTNIRRSRRKGRIAMILIGRIRLTPMTLWIVPRGLRTMPPTEPRGKRAIPRTSFNCQIKDRERGRCWMRPLRWSGVKRRKERGSSTWRSRSRQTRRQQLIKSWTKLAVSWGSARRRRSRTSFKDNRNHTRHWETFLR